MITADTITDEQIRELRDSLIGKWTVVYAITALSRPGSYINGEGVAEADIKAARARCAEILNQRGAK